MPDSRPLNQSALHGFIWGAIDRFSTIGIQFVVNMVLARILMPKDFGIIGMVWIFIAVSQVVIDGGFVSALIQKKNTSQTDFSTIFFSNIGIAAVLYVILFFTTPLIADFYHMPLLKDVLRVLGLWLVLYSVNVVQMAKLRKEMKIKTISIANLSAVSVSGILAIYLAYHGLGVWSLVVQQLTLGCVTTLLYLIITRWVPSLTFSFESWKKLFGYGGYIFLANVLQEISTNIQGIIIGRRFSATEMGYYTQADRLDRVTSKALPMVINQVIFPVFSNIQDDRPRMIELVRMATQLIAFIIFPLMGALIVSADSVVVILFGEKWLQSGVFLQILCVGGMFTCLQSITYHAVAALGFSRQLFVWSVYKWGFLLVAIFVGMQFGIYGIMWAITIGNFNIYLANAFLVQRYVELSLAKQWRVLLPIAIFTTIGMAAGYSCSILLDIPKIPCALITLAVYVGVAIIFKSDAFSTLLVIIRKTILRKQ